MLVKQNYGDGNEDAVPDTAGDVLSGATFPKCHVDHGPDHNLQKLDADSNAEELGRFSL